MTVVTLDSSVRLKKRIRAHLRSLGFTRDNRGHLALTNLTKDTYRSFHEPQRKAKLRAHRDFLKANAETLLKHFANGDEILPQLVTPRLELIESGTWQSDLFRFASLQWQIPVSDGYGRRMRFLVWDTANNKLMGLIALGDPVFNLSARDTYVRWDHKDRSKRLCNVMDAYVLGAVQPYSQLLGGKLIASLIRTQEIRDAFQRKYGDSVGLISRKRKHARLVLVTTTSALGRSSVYNRLRLQGRDYFKSIGYTGGWGHFHISNALFDDIRDFLAERGDPYSDGHQFGSGPNWRLRAIRRALTLLGMSEQLMKHNLTREVFLCELASNAVSFLSGDSTRARFGSQLLSVEDVGVLARERWLIPRAARRPEYRNWRREELEGLFLPHRLKLAKPNAVRT